MKLTGRIRVRQARDLDVKGLLQVTQVRAWVVNWTLGSRYGWKPMGLFWFT